MTRFQIIAEVDARSLDRGSVVRLAVGGHVTPLALDTLRERRITLLRDDGVDGDLERLAPVVPVRTVAIGGDEIARSLVVPLLAHLRRRGLMAHDVGGGRRDQSYPDVASAVAVAVGTGETDAGIVIDASGFGPAVVANKIARVRAATCHSVAQARLAREDAGANVLALGATVVGADDPLAIVDEFLGTAMRDPARQRLLGEVDRLDRNRG
jgi:ribose 5-phosphate isomerase B